MSQFFYSVCVCVCAQIHVSNDDTKHYVKSLDTLQKEGAHKEQRNIQINAERMNERTNDRTNKMEKKKREGERERAEMLEGYMPTFEWKGKTR